jgi:phage-related protein
MRQYDLMRRAIFHPKALETIRLYPKVVRQAIGEAILDLQNGKRIGMPLSRPMPSVAPGVHELRVRDAAGIYRAFYMVKSMHGVLIFHAFEKRTQQTPRSEIDLGARRLKEMQYV